MNGTMLFVAVNLIAFVIMIITALYSEPVSDAEKIKVMVKYGVDEAKAVQAFNDTLAKVDAAALEVYVAKVREGASAAAASSAKASYYNTLSGVERAVWVRSKDTHPYDDVSFAIKALFLVEMIIIGGVGMMMSGATLM
jgi:hypothetical protein